MNDNSYTPSLHEISNGSDGADLQNQEIESAPKPERNRLTAEEKVFAANTAKELLRHVGRQPVNDATRKEILKQLAAGYTKTIGFSGKSCDSVIAEKLMALRPELAVTGRHKESGELWTYNDNKWSIVKQDDGHSLIVNCLHTMLPDGINSRKAKDVFSTLRSIAPNKPTRQPGIIPYRNGIYNIRTGELHQHHPSFGVEGIIPCDYTSEYSQPERFIQFVKAASNENPERHKLMLAQFKYHLENRYRDQIFFENIGDGGCGLSTMQAVITALIGSENTSSIGLDVVDGAKSDKHATVPLVGKQAWIVSDAKKTVSDFPTLKAITGGDPVTIRDMQKTSYQITMPMTVSVFSNGGLQSTDRSGGLFRRRIVIKYDRRVLSSEKDPLLIDKLVAELPNIIQYINKMLPDDQYRQVIDSAKHGQDKLDVMSETESMFGFINECINITGDASDRTQIGSMLTFNKARAKSDHELLMLTGQRTLFGCYQLWCEYKGINRSIKAGFEKAFEDTVNLKCSDSTVVRRNPATRPTFPEKQNNVVSCIEGVRIRQDLPMFAECKELHDLYKMKVISE